jgi:hypothetical protein
MNQEDELTDTIVSVRAQLAGQSSIRTNLGQTQHLGLSSVQFHKIKRDRDRHTTNRANIGITIRQICRFVRWIRQARFVRLDSQARSAGQILRVDT